MTNHIRVSSSPLPRLYSEAKPVIAPVHSALCDLSSLNPLSLPSLVIAPVHSALLERIRAHRLHPACVRHVGDRDLDLVTSEMLMVSSSASAPAHVCASRRRC